MTAKWSRWRYLEARFVTILTIRFKGALVPAWPADRSPTRTGPVEADGAVDAQNAPTAPWKTLLVFHELPQGFPHPITHDKPRKSPESYWETRIDPNRWGDYVHVACKERSGASLQKLEERGITQQRYLHRLGHTGPPVSERQGLDEANVVDDRERRQKRADEVFLPEQVDPVPDTDPGVPLREHRRRHTNRPDASVCKRGGETGHVKHRPAADDHYERVPIGATGVDLGQHPVRLSPIVLTALATRHDHWRTGELERLRMPGHVILELGRQRRRLLDQGPVENEQQPMAPIWLPASTSTRLPDPKR